MPHLAASAINPVRRMNTSEFRQLVANATDAELFGPCLSEDITPFVFDTEPDSWDVFRSELSDALGVQSGDIRIVGSGRLGFSLRPGRNLRPYSDRSDVDVAIISAAPFDLLWHGLLYALYPRQSMPTVISGWLKNRRNELYTGWLSPLAVRVDHKIFGQRAQDLLDFNARWFNTFKSVSRHVPRRHEDINVRLYRTWGHAELYHRHSISSLRKTLT